ncbi:hypothetical protein Tco_0626683 [Tanacetum coccineum]|uniref:Uncharacterized protein n=1 Tax=Tanacetum coccineum TaxID=301880 RepID=A0ABQ4WK96_9ASTR
MCLGAEVRMRVEHTLEQKDKLEDKCVEQAALLSEKDVEIADLKSLLSLKEAEVIEAILFRGQLFVVEAADAAKAIKSERDSLADQRSLLESAFKLFKGRMDACRLSRTVLGKGFYEVRCLSFWRWMTHLEGRFFILASCQHIWTTVDSRLMGLKLYAGGIKKRDCIWKAGRDLSVIEAYDPSAKANNVDAMNALRTVDFSLLSVLKSKKDACMADLMVIFLRLEGPLVRYPSIAEKNCKPII